MRWIVFLLCLGALPARALPPGYEEEHSQDATITFPGETTPRTGRIVFAQPVGRRRFLGWSREIFFDEDTATGTTSRVIENAFQGPLKDLLKKYSRVTLTLAGFSYVALLEHITFRYTLDSQAFIHAVGTVIKISEKSGTFGLVGGGSHQSVEMPLDEVTPLHSSKRARGGCLAWLLSW